VLKRAWLSVIDKTRPWPRRRREYDALLWAQVGAMAAKWAKSWDGSKAVRAQVEPLLHEALDVFFGTSEEIVAQDLGAAATAAISDHKGKMGPKERGRALTHDISDDDVACLLELLRQWWSLPAQREAIETATNYELVRARRAWHVFLGSFGRPSLGRDHEWRAFAITFGKPAIPLLLRLLRGPYASWIIRTLLSISLAMRGRISDPRDAIMGRRLPEMLVSRPIEPRSSAGSSISCLRGRVTGSR
jgi:hypothetical protein